MALAFLGFSTGCGRSLIYHPTRLDGHALEELATKPGWTQNRLPVGDDATLAGLMRPGPSSQTMVLLYFGGNAMSLANAQDVLTLLAGDSSDFLASWAYRSYDASTGVPTEKSLVSDGLAEAALVLEKSGLPSDRLVIIGQSLGTGIATQVAARLTAGNRPPAGLLLVAPFTSMGDVFDEHVPLLPVGWLAADEFDSANVAPDIQIPVRILHGTEDRVIPIEQGKTLARAFGTPARLTALEGRGHNDIWRDSRAIAAAQEFLNALRLSPRGRSDCAGSEEPTPAED